MVTLVKTRQFDNQDPIEFDYYLDSVEKEFHPLPPKERAYQFFAKLTDSLRDEILKSVPTLPDNRSDMVNLASRHWAISRARKPYVPKTTSTERKKPRQDDDESTPRSKPDAAPRFQNKQPEGKEGRNPTARNGKTMTCFTCGSTEHLADNCPEKEKAQQ